MDVAEPGLKKCDLFREAIRNCIRVQAAKRVAAPAGRAPHIGCMTVDAQRLICAFWPQRG
ncbi:MAG: hypothetical protein NTV17_16385 [Burkholderiales bacterium]|nr:hypothetical protein [Burkholderiales bacterium]